MSFFDFFGNGSRTKSEEPRDNRTFSGFDSEPTVKEEPKQSPYAVFFPESYDDVQKIIDVFKAGKTAIVHLTKLRQDTCIRVFDMLCGAIYAVDGGVYEVEKNIFMFSPQGIEVK